MRVRKWWLYRTIPLKTERRHKAIGLLSAAAPGQNLYIASSLKLFPLQMEQEPWGEIAKCSEKAFMFLSFFSLLQLYSLCRSASETDWMKCSCGRNFCETLVSCMVMCVLQSGTLCTSIRRLHPNLFTKCLSYRCAMGFSNLSIMVLQSTNYA